jgi:soluble lytic murein transglycosylase-like protein
MVYPREADRRWLFIKKSMGWVFALTVGLMVCIADVKLPAGTGRAEDERSRPEALVLGTDAFPESMWTAACEPQLSDLSAAVYIPAAEPQIYPYDLIVHEAAGRYNIDADLLLAIIMVESGFNPRAISKKGAKGLMQLMPETAYALEVGNVYCPEENVKAGARHLRWLLERFEGDVKLALAAYNAGVQNVLRYDGVPPYGETRAYVTKVLGHYAAFKDDSFAY